MAKSSSDRSPLVIFEATKDESPSFKAELLETEPTSLDQADLDQANPTLNGESVSNSFIGFFNEVSRVANAILPALILWKDNFLQNWMRGFFIFGFTVDAIKFLFQNVALAYADTVNAGKIGEYLFNLTKLGVLCTLTIGVLTVASVTHLIFLGLILGLDILVNLGQTLYYFANLLVEGNKLETQLEQRKLIQQELINTNKPKMTWDEQKKFGEREVQRVEFFGKETIQHAFFTAVSAIATAVLTTLVVFTIMVVVPVIESVSITVGTIGGIVIGGLSALGLWDLGKTGLKKLSKWWNPQETDKLSIEVNVPEATTIEHTNLHRLEPKNNPPILKKLDTNEKSLLDWEYYEHVGLPQLSKNELLVKIEEHHHALSTPTSWFLSFDKKTSDKKNALALLSKVVEQWDAFLEQLNFHFNPGHQSRQPVKSDLDLPKPKVIFNFGGNRNYFSINLGNIKVDYSHLTKEQAEEKYRKEIVRILKHTKKGILRKYKLAFQSMQYKGKVEALFEQAAMCLEKIALEKYNNIQPEHQKNPYLRLRNT